MDAVQLAEILEDSVQLHGPRTGLDIALPLFERRMLSRSARVVVASHERAKELHSSKAKRPARRGQVELGAPMPEIIQLLRDKGIGAHSASDPRGLDAVVAEAIGISDLTGRQEAEESGEVDGCCGCERGVLSLVNGK